MDDFGINKFRTSRNLIALTEIPGLGRRKIGRLVTCLKNWEKLEISELLEIGVQQKILKELPSKKMIVDGFEKALSILETCERFGIQVMTCLADDYPQTLVFEDSPLVIYHLGNIRCLNHPRRAAVIGSRNPGRNGYDFAYQAAAALAERDVAVISGLAVGCDTAGHRGALSKKGMTAAFLPSGLLNIYPQKNRELAEEIIDQSGCLISEYPPNAEAKPYRFIERDRLQAASSLIVITSVFSENGGTIHTLKYANQLGRSIYTGSEIFKIGDRGFRKLDQMGISCTVSEIPEIIGVFDQF